MLKRSLFLLVTILTFVTHGIAFAAPEVNVGKVTGTAGAKVTVPVNFVTNGATNVASFTIDITYDATKLSNPTATIGAAATAASKGLDTTLLNNPTAIEALIFAANSNAVSSGVLYTLTFDVSPTATGAIPLTINFIEVADNGAPTQAVTATSVNGSVTIPAAAPTVTDFAIPATGNSFIIPITTFTASNAVAYLITENPTAPAASAITATTAPTTFTVTGYTAHTLYAWVKNSDGVVSAPFAGKTTTLTESLATVTAFAVPASSYSLDIPITTFTASTNAGAFLITESATPPAASAITATTAPTSFTVTGFNTYTLYAWVKNASGVVSAPFAGAPTTVSEKPAPVLTITAPANNFVTKNDTINVTGTATKNTAAGSGEIAGVKVNGVDVGTLGQDGAFTKNVTLTDGANVLTIVASDNSTPPVTTTVIRTVTKDTTPPTLAVTSPAEGLKTKESPVNIAGTVSDTNDIKSLTVNGNTVAVTNGAYTYPLILTVEGPVAINVVATDNADNVTTVTRTITYDITPMSLTVSTPAANSQTKDTAVTVTGTISEADGTVEIKNTTNNITASATVTSLNYTGTIQLIEGSNDIQVTVTDQAGNKSTAVSRAITRDSIPPALAITDPGHDVQVTVAAVTIKGTTDATATEVKLTFNGEEHAQTIAAGTFTFEQAITIPAVDSVFPVVVTAKDALGNSSSVTRNIVYTQAAGDIGAPGIEKLVESLKAYQSAHNLLPEPLTALEKVKLDCAPLNADGTPNPDGVIDGGDVILLLRRAAGLAK